MQWFSAIFTAGMVTAAFYGLQYIVEQKMDVGFRHKGKWITDFTVILTLFVTFVGTMAVGVIRLSQLGMTRYLLIAVLLCGLAVLTVTDCKKQMVPNKIILILLLLWTAIVGSTLIFDIETGFELLCRALGGGLISGLIFLLCYLFSRGQMGAGDVKLAFVMGLYLTGERIMGALFYGTVLCCIYSIVQLIRKKLTLKNGVPMTPFLFLGTFITLLIQ